MPLLIICLGLFILYGALKFAEAAILRNGDGEPMIVREKRIPFVGHLIGLARNGVSYYRYLRESTSLPILTITILGQKIYIVNSPALVSQINRRQKIIDSSPPFISIVFEKLFQFDKDDIAILSHAPVKGRSLRGDTQVAEHRLLERGTKSLESLSKAIMDQITKRFESVGSKGPEEINLYSWLQELIPLATADAVFGPNHPFADNDSLLREFWEFEGGLKALTMFPRLMALRPARARTTLVHAFKSYAETKCKTREAHQSELVHELVAVTKHHRRTDAYIGRYLFALFTAFAINSVPVTFWMMAHILTDKGLRETIRSELCAARLPKELSIPAIREQCPTLVSTLNEVLRYVSSSTGTMVIHEDIRINDQYLLKRGGLVQIAATAIHSDPDVWGKDADSFDPFRSLKSGGKGVHPAALRTFGGGSTLCPGRHLAVDQILAFAAQFFLSFDIDEAIDTQNLPLRDTKNMLSVMKPKSDLVLKLSRRNIDI
ncbi:cytochrome P450 [Xylariaceae sp. FL0255]|nr:cytochrome P450 [Xylariaceae sp. FL0255]